MSTLPPIPTQVSSHVNSVLTFQNSNLVPGGWIEHWEPIIGFQSDDGTLPADSILAGWAKMFIPFMDASGKKATTGDTMKEKIVAGGFTNIQEKLYKVCNPTRDLTIHADSI